jgi:23S rRNA (guanosine2251-2'-O)-methyltransferase
MSQNPRSIILIAHNLRSCHNVGSLFRTAEGLGITKVICSGYTPYPATESDSRMPHLAAKIDRQIQKTALGAEQTIDWSRSDDIFSMLAGLASEGYVIAALEQDATSSPLQEYIPPEKLALIVGREVDGIEPEVLAACSAILQIPMFGSKESFNVVQAAAMALYHIRFANLPA